jgi:hypothetical protein
LDLVAGALSIFAGLVAIVAADGILLISGRVA